MEIGLKLRKNREAKRLSQSEVAYMIGVSQSTYFTWESGEQVNIRMKYVAKIVEVLGIDLSELIPKSATLRIEDDPKIDFTIKEQINFTSNAHLFFEEMTATHRKMITLLEDKIYTQNQVISQLQAELGSYNRI